MQLNLGLLNFALCSSLNSDKGLVQRDFDDTFCVPRREFNLSDTKLNKIKINL